MGGLVGPSGTSMDQARLWLERPLELLEDCAAAYGDVFELRLGSFGAIVIVGHPEGARAVFEAPGDRFECRHFNESYRFVMGERSLFLQDGADHRRLQKALVPLFVRGDPAEHAGDLSRLAFETVERHSRFGSLAVLPAAQEFALGTVLRIIFGASGATGVGPEVFGWFREYVWRDRRSWKPWTALSRLQPRLRELIERAMNDVRDRPAPAPSSLFDRLTGAVGQGPGPLAAREIEDLVRTLLVTAVDAAGAALGWALYQVGRRPRVQERLRRALGPSGDVSRALTDPYWHAVCQEVLRLNPVLPTVSARRLTAPLALPGRTFEAGATLAPCQYLVHRRADLYDRPLEFEPERFLGRRYGPSEYFPFGGGHRVCLGSTLVPLEMKVLLAAVVCRWRIERPHPEKPEVVRYGTILAPPADLTVELAPIGRSSPARGRVPRGVSSRSQAAPPPLV